MKISKLAFRIAECAIVVVATYTFCSNGSANLRPQDSRATEITDTSKAANISIRLHTSHIFLEVRVNGKGPYAFVLDTGAPYSVVDSRIATETNLIFVGESTAGGSGEEVRRVQIADDVNLELPGVNLASQSVAALSLDGLESNLGCRIDGILGFDLFQRFVVEIDYASSRLRVYNNKDFLFNGEGEVVSVATESRVCLMKATCKFPGQKSIEGEFKIDTGSNSQLRLNSPFVAKHNLAEKLEKTIDSNGFGIGGMSSNSVTRIESFEIGRLKFNSPVILMSRAKGRPGANARIAGIVGGGLLKRCNVIFDFKRKRMILRPYPNFDSPFECDMLGIRWKTGGRGNPKSFVVSTVLVGSPADKAGFKVGDQLVEVDGIKSERLSIPFLQEMARTHNKVVQLIVKRGEKTIKHEIKLVRLL